LRSRLALLHPHIIRVAGCASWFYAAKAARPFGMGVVVSAELPSLWEFLMHIGVFIVVEDM
jgi:hypothetical protein